MHTPRGEVLEGTHCMRATLLFVCCLTTSYGHGLARAERYRPSGEAPRRHADGRIYNRLMGTLGSTLTIAVRKPDGQLAAHVGRLHDSARESFRFETVWGDKLVLRYDAIQRITSSAPALEASRAARRAP